MERVPSTDSVRKVNLRWEIDERSPAIVNRIEIAGNDYTHESCIREQIVLAPGQVFNRNYLIRSYQNIGNLNFFETPMAAPETRPSGDQGDVDIVFNVKEKRTGNINFGASMGQGTGLGGFIGLDQPNLLGRCKRAQVQWQFGRYINDFNVTYSDPNIRQSRISGSVTAYHSRSRFQIAELGGAIRTGGQIQLGFPVPNSLYTRLFVSYGGEKVKYAERRPARDGRERVQELLPLDARLHGNTRHADGAAVPGRRRPADLQRAVQRRTAGWHRGVPAVHYRAALVCANRPHRRQPVGWRADDVRGRALGSRRRRLRQSGPVLLRPSRSRWAERSTVSSCAVTTSSPSRPTVSIRALTRHQASRSSFGNAFFVGTGGARAQGQSIALLEHFLRRRQCLDTSRGNSIRRGCSAASASESAPLSPLGPLGVDLGYGLDKIDAQGRPAPGWKLHFKLGQFF